MALGRAQWVPGGSWVGLVSSLAASPHFRALRDTAPVHCKEIKLQMYASTQAPGARNPFLRRTRVDPCIKCTRSKLDTCQGVLGLVAPEDLLSVCCLVLPLVLSSVVLSPLVSSCLGFSALVSSCVVCWASPGPFLGLSRASLGTHFGPPEGHFEAPGGSWGSRALLGLSRAAPGQSLGRSWGTLGAP